jgi:hypothetical protein
VAEKLISTSWATKNTPSSNIPVVNHSFSDCLTSTHSYLQEKEDTSKAGALAEVAEQAKATNDLKKDLDQTRLDLEKAKEGMSDLGPYYFEGLRGLRVCNFVFII